MAFHAYACALCSHNKLARFNEVWIRGLICIVIFHNHWQVSSSVVALSSHIAVGIGTSCWVFNCLLLNAFIINVLLLHSCERRYMIGLHSVISSWPLFIAYWKTCLVCVVSDWWLCAWRDCGVGVGVPIWGKSLTHVHITVIHARVCERIAGRSDVHTFSHKTMWSCVILSAGHVREQWAKAVYS